MKRLYAVLAAMFAFALVVAAPETAITSHAMGFTGAGGEHESSYSGPNTSTDSYWNDSSSSDSGSSNSAPSAPSYSAPSDNGGSDDSSHHDSGSSDNGNSYDGGYTDNGSSDNGNGNGGAPSAPAKNPNDMTVSAAGGQPFRIVMNSAHTAYDIYHCGIKQGTVTVTDTEGNPVAYQSIAVEQGDDGLNYVNITFAEGVDTSKLTVTIGNTCASYLAQELGVSGLKVNGVVKMSVPTKR